MSGYRAHFSMARVMLFSMALGLAVFLAALWIYYARPLEGGYAAALATLAAVREEGMRQTTLTGAYICALLAVTVFLISLIGSHRICGPVYRMCSAARKAAGGDFTARVLVRRSDHLRDTAGSMDDTLESVRERLSGIRAAAERLRAASEEMEQAAGPLDEEQSSALAEKLSEGHQELRDRLSYFNT